jgi:hypothetical protein
VGDGRTVADNQLEGEAWCRLDDELLAWRRALYTRSTLFYVGVVRTSVAPSALHTLFSSATWWRAHYLLELGTDSYTEVVPARLWRQEKCEERDGGRRRHRQYRPTATNRE